jgi:2-dehydropantoate 2-reductase
LSCYRRVDMTAPQDVDAFGASFASGKGPRILVIGAGGIGGITAGTLGEVGADVTVVSTNAAIRDAVAKDGFRIRDDGEERRVYGRIVAAPDPGERFGLVVLATQPPQVEAAARAALPFLADDGDLVVLQNGLCEERVEAILAADGPARGRGVVGAIVAWGASMLEPGVYDKTAAGGFTIGRWHGGDDERVRALATLLEAVGPTQVTDNLRGARWSKLAINCAISSIGTIGGERIGPLVAVRRFRRLAIDLMTETVDVARAEKVKLEKVSGTLDLDWMALSASERTARGSAGLAAKHALLYAVGLRFRRMRSSMLAAIERGRVPAIDFLCGEVVTRGERHGVPTPVSRRVVELVWAIARREETSSYALLDRLYADTRPG